MHPENSTAEPSWTRGELAAALFIVAFLAWQLALPAAKLCEPRPAQFGWQMFSSRHRPARVSVVLPNGEVRTVQPSWFLEVSRGDLRFEQALARHLCRTEPRLVEVRLEPEAAAATVLPCRP